MDAHVEQLDAEKAQASFANASASLPASHNTVTDSLAVLPAHRNIAGTNSMSATGTSCEQGEINMEHHTYTLPFWSSSEQVCTGQAT